eukprot:scaffold12744_cov42-Cyclotella_meneghiniana.AAC.1
MENHIVVISVEAELQEGAGGGGTLLAKEGDVDGTVGGGEDYPAGGGGLRAVHLAHDDSMLFDGFGGEAWGLGLGWALGLD